MKIYTKVVMEWDGSRYVTTYTEGHEFDGPVALCCGASSQQTSSYNQQAGITQQIMQQGQSVFGQSSQVFNDLVSSLAPTVAAGPNQQGFSPAELSNLQSSAVTQTGIAARNAESATGNAIAAEGGGNTGPTSGANLGIQEGIATSVAANESNELNQINEANYQTGRQNYNTAVSGMLGATSVFNPATGLDNSEANAAENQSNTANQIAQESNSWIQGVTGALGSVAGAATSGGLSLLKNSGSGSGGGQSSANT